MFIVVGNSLLGQSVEDKKFDQMITHAEMSEND